MPPLVLGRLRVRAAWPSPERMVVCATTLVPHRGALVVTTRSNVHGAAVRRDRGYICDYSLVPGPIVDWYPYPFLDPREDGYGAVAVASGGITAVVVALAWLVARRSRWRAGLAV